VTRHDHSLARALYARPDASAMIKHLPDLGQSLQSAAIDLAKDCSLPRIDEMLARLKGAETSLLHLRRALAER
jgi:hypothetical protein